MLCRPLFCSREWSGSCIRLTHFILSAVKACLTSLGTRPSASQLVACTVTSLPYKPYTNHGKKPHSRRFEVASSSKCRLELLRSGFRSNSGEKLKLAIDVDDLLDGLWIAAIASELHAEDHAMDTPKIEFSVNKILAEGFFDNPSHDILDHHSKCPFIQLWFAKSCRFNSG